MRTSRAELPPSTPQPSEGLTARTRDGDLLATRRYERNVPSTGGGHGLGQWVLALALGAFLLAPATYGVSFLLSPFALALSQLERRRGRRDGRAASELSELGRKMGWAVLLLVYLPLAVSLLIGYVRLLGVLGR